MEEQMFGLKEDSKLLAKELKYVNNSIIFHCQKNCFRGSIKGMKEINMDEFEKGCLKKCLD